MTIVGYNFRNTLGFVTDGAGETFVNHSSWSAGAFSTNSNAGLDRRLAGSVYRGNDGLQSTYTVALSDGAGTYRLRVALGDASGPESYSYLQVRDGATPVLTLDKPSGHPSAEYYDAGGTLRTAAAWPGSNASQDVTFAGSTITLVIGAPTNVGSYTTLAHVSVEFIPAVGGAVESLASGTWNTGATWVGGVVPTTTTAVIKSPHVVTVTAGMTIGADLTASVAIQVEVGATLTINPDLTVNALGDVQVSGVVNVEHGSFFDVRAVVEGSGPTPVTRRLTINPTGVVNANGTYIPGGTTGSVRLGSTKPNATVIDGTGILNATYTWYDKLYGMDPYGPGFPQGAGVTRLHPISYWQEKMIRWGLYHHNLRVTAPGGTILDVKINSTYYDGPLVNYLIEQYTGDPTTWRPAAVLCADWRKEWYDGLAPPGSVSGYENYTAGLWYDFELDGDTASKTSALNVSLNAAYSQDSTPADGPGSTDSWVLSREAALALYGYLVAEQLGQAPRTRRVAVVTDLYNHWTQICVDQTWLGSTTLDVQPWIHIGLCFRSLEWDWRQTGDARFLPAVTVAAEYFWNHGWDAATESFLMSINPDYAGYYPAPDLNLLCAPIYAFLWKQTGESVWRDRYDAVFAGGLRQGYLGGTLNDGKKFNQNYLFSFQGQTWRAMTPTTGGGGGGTAFASSVIGR